MSRSRVYNRCLGAGGEFLCTVHSVHFDFNVKRISKGDFKHTLHSQCHVYLAAEALEAGPQAVGVVLQLSGLGVDGVALRVGQTGGLRRQQSERI